ncbi:alkaline phosphatase family protein [Gloeobacter kilaueensis]|uniref:Type I phosphodiesterase/nucleotide pyrophosphatase n=1 Tax=Gloeobacter kilaueensis (strain ATCC BAA-2537 / CCAP 1431/1 / ULC 316 / JS1) TaxID=1183438 RepID=U5QFH4_GLOK1|nr:alkaline phosphatase family protein [Gloeobacter kilaueensis]AGY57722.1 type I phosphodiesterase/nucleotide pyrophosphatase [Gloeobacter kilaueensis JS1]
MKHLPSVAVAALASLVAIPSVWAQPKVVLISLDSANPTTFAGYIQSGVFDTSSGLGLLQRLGTSSIQNLTITPSITAPGHIAIATGSRAAHNDINANTFHLVASNFSANISGFGAPIGGYAISGPAVSPEPTATPIWVTLRAAGKKVVTATWPGGDGVDVKDPTSGNLLQPSSLRTVDYTVPFGTFGGVGAQGFALGAVDFTNAGDTLTSQLVAAGYPSYSPVKAKATALETINVSGTNYTINLAAIDSTNDGVTNYDTLVFYDANLGVQPGPFTLPSTGPAYVRADGHSRRFYFEGNSNKAGSAYYASFLAPDLSTVRIARYSVNYIPRNTPVLASVDDINNNVGFWGNQPDFRIPERISSGFDSFPDTELEGMYEDQVSSFVQYQTNIALRAISQNPDADLVMVYIEQPDGSGHQFTLTDPRQATNFKDPNTIGTGQDPAKVSRYATYRQNSYTAANSAVQQIIAAVGQNSDGTPRSNVFVVSDHGMAPFHTAVNINNLLTSVGIDTTKVRAVTTGPDVNVYIKLQGREADGTVSPSDYPALQKQIFQALSAAGDPNPTFNYSLPNGKLFRTVIPRPTPANVPVGFATNQIIGQDTGDVFAILNLGYNFDGTQSPVVQRKGDVASTTPVLSQPNFYGAHGYDSKLPEMSAIFFAAGPNIRKAQLPLTRNIDVAPTILKLLGVAPAATVDGRALQGILK